MNNMDTIPQIILISAMKESPIRIPIKTDAIPFIICPAAFVNPPIDESELSYSMLLILVPGAIIFVPAKPPSVQPRSVLLALLKFSLVEISAYKCGHSIAMRQIFEKFTFVLCPISANDCPSDLLIFFPFS
jgi:hypothetical protein